MAALRRRPTRQNSTEYSRDLTKMARDGKLDPVIGRAQEIENHHRGAGPAQEEQPGADRRGRV